MKSFQLPRFVDRALLRNVYICIFVFSGFSGLIWYVRGVKEIMKKSDTSLKSFFTNKVEFIAIIRIIFFYG